MLPAFAAYTYADCDEPAVYPASFSTIPSHCCCPCLLQELEQRPDLVSKAKQDIELKRSVVKAWVDTKPWINAEETESVVKAVRHWGWGCRLAGMMQQRRAGLAPRFMHEARNDG